MVLVVKNDIMYSFCMDMFWIMSIVDGVKHYITQQNVMHISGNINNLISIA